MSNSLVVALLVLLFACSHVLAWGPGHDHVNRLALEVLPRELRDALPEDVRKKIVKWSHAPDDFTPWEKLKQVRIHADDLAYLHSQGMKHPYSLHSARGQAVNFILLVRAFRANDPDRIAFWTACLMHTLADEAACNHDPLIHYMTYAFKGGYGMKMGRGVGLDFADVAKTDEGMRVIRSLLKGFEAAPLGESPDDILVRIMMGGLRANDFMTQRGARIAATFATKASRDVVRDGRQALAELGVYGIEHSVNMMWTAWLLRRTGVKVELTGAVGSELKRRRAAFLKSRPLEHDSVFSGLLAKSGPRRWPHHVAASPGRRPALGVVIEPSQRMNDGHLGFSAKYISAACMRALKRSGIPYRPLDLREMEERPLPSPRSVPLVIVCSGKFGPGWARERLKAYADAGGRILVIGGEHGNVLGELSKCLKPADDRHLPVSRKYGRNNTERIGRIRVRFLGPMAKALGEREYMFTHNPDTKAGWQKPGCFYSLSEASPGIRPLAQVSLDDKSLHVAGAGLDRRGRAKFIFLPEYLVAPYLLSDVQAIEDPSRPELDPVGKAVLRAALEMLVPGLAASRVRPR